VLQRFCSPRNAALSSAEPQAHFDYFHDQLNTQNGGQRVATVLMYLCAGSERLRCAPLVR
jgi:hypothetical protein